MRYSLLAFLLLLLPFLAISQEKKELDHSDYKKWREIQGTELAADGDHVLYRLDNERVDPTLNIQALPQGTNYTFERATNAHFSYDGQYAFFMQQPPYDSLQEMRRRKVKDEDLLKDTLVIFTTENGQTTAIPHVQSYKTPAKGNGWLAYLLEAAPKDTSETAVKRKKESKKNGYRLVVRELTGAEQDTFDYVTGYEFAEKGNALLFHSTGDDSLFLPGIYRYDLEERELQPMLRGKGKYEQMTISEDGEQVAFLAHQDTVENALVEVFSLYHWQAGADSARAIVDSAHQNMPTDWLLNPFQSLRFSENAERLFFNIYEPPAQPDTTLLEEEKVSVEVWSWHDEYLQTQQEVDKEEERKRGYLAVYHVDRQAFIPLASQEVPEVRLDEKMEGTYALGYSNLPYGRFITWEGFPPYHDIYTINIVTGEQKKVAQKVKGFPNISTDGKYLYWYSAKDTAHIAYDPQKQQTINLSANIPTQIWDELHDYPDYPSPYGSAGWTENDAALLIYDRYDIWKVNPQNPAKPERLTNGRPRQLRYRYMHFDPNDRSIATDEALYLQGFDEHTKGEGYYRLDWQQPGDQQPEQLLAGEFALSYPDRARLSERVVFTKQTFEEFPNLISSTLEFDNVQTISNANPQQADYRWGTDELVQWVSLDGEVLEGLLIKPEGFDPTKKYPMIVNFYERSSDGLYRHRAPEPHRSTINYSFYASRGYLIFSPDVPYTPGYPGESAFNAVMPGISHLISQGFVDKDRIGVQGHSWGGYQIAYLVTRTDLFAAAESGAPVVNMFSAYGGIRWQTGLSRQFQYEHSQSRIGGTPWEYPLRYLENSPVFFLDKIETPLLIMHNDKDGHVPWYQGIEFFTGLRRLQKPAWMLNYNNEPHWPLDYQLMVDFSIRMQQFFDHYLKDAPMPEWMEKGVPAVNKGIDLGYEPVLGEE